jgi:hypothetical protein
MIIPAHDNQSRNSSSNLSPPIIGLILIANAWHFYETIPPTLCRKSWDFPRYSGSLLQGMLTSWVRISPKLLHHKEPLLESILLDQLSRVLAIQLSSQLQIRMIPPPPSPRPNLLEIKADIVIYSK